MKKELDSYNSKTFSYPRDLKGSFRILKYLVNFIKIQFQMSFWLKKHKPDYVLVPTEWALTYLFLPFYFSKSIIVFRCGDDPLTYRKKINGLLVSILYYGKNHIKEGRCIGT